MTASTLDDHVEHRQVEPPSNRRFALTVGSILFALAAVRLVMGRTGALTGGMMAVAVLLIAAGIVAPKMLGPVNRAWMKTGYLMASVVNPLFMFVIFTLVFTPVALVTRLAGRDILQLRRGRTQDGYWFAREPGEGTRDRLNDQF